MNTARLHGSEGINGPRKFALQRSQIIDLLGKFADAERRLLDNLESDIPPGHAFTGKF